MDIKELQNEILKIAVDFDAFCKRNDIKYFLMGGSALGAIRHKGFIPWDDDFDVFMTRESYIKFMDIAEKDLDKKYYFQRENTKEWPLFFSKIKRNDTIFVECDNERVNHKGIFIDIFCLNNQSDSRIVANIQYICAKILIAKTLHKRGYASATLKKKICMLIARIIACGKLEKVYLAMVQCQNNKTTEKMAHYFGKAAKKNLSYPRHYFDKAIYVKFENVMLPVVCQVEEYLTMRFGDYMKLPSEQEIKHSAHSKNCEYYINYN